MARPLYKTRPAGPLSEIGLRLSGIGKVSLMRPLGSYLVWHIIHRIDGRSTRFVTPGQPLMLLPLTRGASQDLHAWNRHVVRRSQRVWELSHSE